MDKKDKVFIIIACILFFTLLCSGGTAVYYKNKYDRLMEQHRMELKLARQRADALTDTLSRAREEVGAIGESLSRQRTSTAQLRELIGEVRTRYEKMEELLSGAGWGVSNIYSDDSCIDCNNGE